MLSLLLTAVVAVVAVAPVSAPTDGRQPASGATGVARPAEGRVPALRMPVAGTLVRGFEAPAGPYGPGHRGIDLAAPVGQPLRAPAAGRILFAGPVAGRVWVSLLVAPGVVVTVGPLLGPVVAVGRRVGALEPVGRLGPGHAGALHLGLRVDGVYVDPLPYLVDRPRARLAPLLDPGGLAGADRRRA
jgi:murein DD-endopeptidase MepM/ murein hydrolase activator NlpD